MKLTVLGDVLLDRDLDGEAERLCPDSPAPVVDHRQGRARPGGAGLAAVVAALLGGEVTLVSALGRDGASAQVRALLDAAGVAVTALPAEGETAEKLRVRAGGQTLVRIDRGGIRSIGADTVTDRSVASALDGAAAVLVADYGGGVAAHPHVRRQVEAFARHRPVVWDPHPRGAPPVPGAWLLTPNEREVGAAGGPLGATAAAARRLRDRHGARAVAVTRGERGAILVAGDGPPLVIPCDEPVEGDVSGAGDAFATGAALALGGGAVHSEAVAAAVAAGAAFVGSLHRRTWSAETPPAPTTAAVPPPPDLRAVPADRSVSELIARTRAAGGTVVMTGGCFDLLHRGHVQLLRHARALGDCLVVCLNSDESVRRLKGPNRPVVGAADRAGVLRALEAVDDVVVFDEDTPVDVLRRHRPDVFVKGGDYRGADLPEAAALAEWGGDVVIVPYLDGHSTTRLLQEVLHGR